MKNVKTKLILAMILGMSFAACAKSSEKREPTVTGKYEKQMPDGSTDILIFKDDGTMSLELTRQVGGPGGISENGVVPYPTVCRVKQFGVVTKETAKEFSYSVRFVELADLTGLKDSEACGEYVKAFNNIIHAEGVEFTLEKPQENPPK